MSRRSANQELSPRDKFIPDRVHDFLTVIDSDYVYELANQSYCAAMGRPSEEIVGRSVAELWGDELFESTLKSHIDRCLAGETVSYIERFQFGDEMRYVNVTYYPYPESDGNATHVVVTSRDITHLGELEDMLMKFEYRDPATGLLNRKSLMVLLEVELLKAQRAPRPEPRALILIAIETLPDISRRHGYDIADRILENTGIRIKEVVREDDFVFRFRANELAVLVSRMNDEADAQKIALKIIRGVVPLYRFHGADIVISCRAGVAVFPKNGLTPETLIRCSSIALADAVKESTPVRSFERTAEKLISRRLKFESDLRRAFERGQFELYFQPIMRANGGIEGAESLIRWNLPHRGIVSPGEFLPVAVETGMMWAIARWTVFAAIRQMMRLCRRYPIYLTVNLTASDFESEELTELLEAALCQSDGQGEPQHIKLEITESDAMQDVDRVASRIALLQEKGFDVYIDDFGTGQSSLAQLRELPATTVKIDKSFVWASKGDSTDDAFIRYIVELLKIKGKRVIAEGVQTIEQLELLREVGCDSFQGFYFAAPLPIEAFESFLARHFDSREALGEALREV